MNTAVHLEHWWQTGVNQQLILLQYLINLDIQNHRSAELNFMKYDTWTDGVRNEGVKEKINSLKTNGRLLHLKTQFVPRSKHFSSRL